MDASPPRDRSSGGLVAILLFVVFAAAAATTAVELLLPRLLAPHVGTTTVPWATSIAVVMLGMAAGNAIGGVRADRSPRPLRTLALSLLAAAGATAILGPLVSDSSSDSGSLWLRAFLLTAPALPAVALLGMVSPLATTHVARASGRPGHAVGRFVAAGALGSLVGVYATGFAVIPAMGVKVAVAGVGGLLAVIGVAVAWVARASSKKERESPADAAPESRRRRADAMPVRSPARALSTRTAMALAAAAGLATLIVEIVAARTAARIVGNGLYSWTSVLGAVLAGLVVGGAVGGILADRPDPKRTLTRLLVLASALALLAAWSPQVLVSLTRESGASRPFRIALGALAAWMLPCAVLGAIPPVAARAALGGRDDGHVIGRVWAAQTIGCVTGALLTAPLLIPLLSTRGTLVAVAIGLAALPRLVGARLEKPWLAALAVALLATVLPLEPARKIGRALALRSDGSAILARESAYQAVRVDVPKDARYAALGRPGLRQLALDDLVHNVVDLDDPNWLGYDYEGLYAAVTARLVRLEDDGRPVRALFVGGGACTFSRWLHRRRPQAEIDVVELDPAVTQAAVDGMGLAPSPGFRIVHADGRTFVRDARRSGATYDLVYGDAYDDVAVPWHLTTYEYAREIRDVLAPGGAYVMNVIDAEGGGRFLAATVLTLQQARFENVAVLSLGEPSNGRDTFVVVASRRPDVHFLGLRRPDPSRKGATDTLPVTTLEPLALQDLVAKAGGLVLTDDHAPVEWLLAPVAGTSAR